mmetsp:Transcript_4899/g.12283  ORF Transcript_4899/g.12283 Transcript_4899/m.12283 type:complete len:210 (-) Transcript_4899:620-1249(-)
MRDLGLDPADVCQVVVQLGQARHWRSLPGVAAALGLDGRERAGGQRGGDGLDDKNLPPNALQLVAPHVAEEHLVFAYAGAAAQSAPRALMQQHLASVRRHRDACRMVHDGPVVLHLARAHARLHPHGVAGAHPDGEAQAPEDDLVGGVALLAAPRLRQNLAAPAHVHQKDVHGGRKLDAVTCVAERAHKVPLLHLHLVAVVKHQLVADH